MSLNKRIKVGLVQIGDSFGGQHYLPYSIGLLQAFAQKNLENPERFEFKPPVYKRIKIEEAVNYLIDSDIIFFSAYIWNYRISLEIAKGIKKRNTNCIIVFGGPQVPESEEELKAFLSQNTFIDIGCYGEGELPVLRILENFESRLWDKIPSAGFISKDGNFNYNTAFERLEDINKIPSPYLEGIFEPLIEANAEENWSALIETNRGCPYTCAYCYWGVQERSKICKFDTERIFKEIDWLSRNKILFVFCCDANFGIFERDVEIAEKVAQNKRKYGFPQAFSVQNTKNSTQRIFNLQKILNDAGLQKGVNLALQSVNEETLKDISRDNISIDVYKDLQRMFTQEGIPTFSDIIIALPGESYDTFAEGVSKVIENGQHNRIQFINLSVLRNTKMSEPAYRSKYGLITRELKAVSHHASLKEELVVDEKHDIVIGTNSMSSKEWVKTRVFCWMISLLYFDKLLQVPFMLLNKMCSVSHRDLNEVFAADDKSQTVFSGITAFLNNKAQDIQNGDSEYVACADWLNIWWPIDEYIFIKLCRQGLLSKFYEEAEEILRDFIAKRNLEFPVDLLSDVVKFNKSLIKFPFVEKNIDITLRYNIPELYYGALRGESVLPDRGNYTYSINRVDEKWASWDEWLKEVVWYGTKRGAYLYPAILSKVGEYVPS